MGNLFPIKRIHAQLTEPTPCGYGSVGSTITLILLPSVGGMWREGAGERHMEATGDTCKIWIIRGLEILLRNLIFI